MSDTPTPARSSRDDYPVLVQVDYQERASNSVLGLEVRLALAELDRLRAEVIQLRTQPERHQWTLSRADGSDMGDHLFYVVDGPEDRAPIEGDDDDCEYIYERWARVELVPYTTARYDDDAEVGG